MTLVRLIRLTNIPTGLALGTKMVFGSLLPDYTIHRIQEFPLFIVTFQGMDRDLLYCEKHWLEV